MANSSAIITDAFPVDQRGLALGLNMVAGIAGSFLGLVIGGILAPIDWRLVFLVSVPVSLFGTVWAYLRLRDTGVRHHGSIDWWGNLTFGVGLVAMLVGITYGIQPYAGHIMGWTNPWVLAALIGGAAVLAHLLRHRDARRPPDVPARPVPDPRVHRRQPGQPAVRARPGRPDVHPHHLAAGHLAAAARLLLRVHAAVGRHLHAADDGRLPHRRAGVGLPLRPVRCPPLRHRRHARRRAELRVAAAPAGRLHLLAVRRCPAGQRARHGPVRLTEPGGHHERPARRTVAASGAG